MKKNLLLSTLLCTTILAINNEAICSSAKIASNRTVASNEETLSILHELIESRKISTLEKIALLNSPEVNKELNELCLSEFDKQPKDKNNKFYKLVTDNGYKAKLEKNEPLTSLELLKLFRDIAKDRYGEVPKELTSFLVEFEKNSKFTDTNFVDAMEKNRATTPKSETLENATEHLSSLSDKQTQEKIQALLAESEGAITEKVQAFLESSELDVARNSVEHQDLLAREIANIKKLSPEKAKDEMEFLNKSGIMKVFLAKAPTSAAGIGPIQVSDAHATKSVMSHAENVSSIVTSRAITVKASGDDDLYYGIWVKGLYSKGKQKQYGLTAGYNLDQSGVTVGGDVGNDQMMGGLAYSFANSNVKGKNLVTKDNIKSHIATIYGLFNLEDNIFVNAQASYGKSIFKKTRATGNTKKDMAYAKPKGTIMGGQIVFGYNYMATGSSIITPTFGVSHNQVTIKGYTETGKGLNRTVRNRKSSKTSIIAGLAATYKAETVNCTIIPGIHFNVSYAVNSKEDKTIITILQGLDPLITPSGKTAKVLYNAGASVNFVKMQNINVGANYDFVMSDKKFHSHTGTLNLRVNF